MGQEVVIKDIIDKSESDFRRYALYMFLFKLFGTKIYRKYETNIFSKDKRRTA
jgi:hypothetical protein